jgi:hypothetical protein
VTALLPVSEFWAYQIENDLLHSPSTITAFTSKKRLSPVQTFRFLAANLPRFYLTGHNDPLRSAKNNPGFHVEKTAFSKR